MFCTYARNWIFKHVLDEFERPSLAIDNNSVSIYDSVRIRNSTDSGLMLENFIDKQLDPDYQKPKSFIDQLSAQENEGLYRDIRAYIEGENDLSSSEKQILVDTYYENRKVREIAADLRIKPQVVINRKQKAIGKLRRHLAEAYNIGSLADLMD